MPIIPIRMRSLAPMLRRCIAASLPQIRAGKVKAIGITGRQRVSNLPDIPTLDEQGLTGFEMVVWTSIFAPKNLPRPVLERLVAALQGTLADADLVAHFNRTQVKVR